MARDTFFKPNFKNGIQIAGVDFTSLLTAPSYTTTQRNALSSPQDGMIIYNTTTNAYNVRVSGGWRVLITDTGTAQYASAAGGLGLALTYPLGTTAWSIPGSGGTLADGDIPKFTDLGSGTGQIDMWATAGLGGAATYSPSLVQSAAVAKTISRARYITIGKLVFVWLLLTPTANGTANNAVIVGLPVTAQNNSGFIGHGSITIAGTSYRCAVQLTTTSTVVLRQADVTGTSSIGVSPNAALASSGDVINLFCMYEAA